MNEYKYLCTHVRVGISFDRENRKSTTNARAVRDTRRIFASRLPGSRLSDLWVSRVAFVRSGERSPRSRAPRCRLPVSGLFNLLYSVHALGGEKAAPATRMEVDGHDIGAWMIVGECTFNLFFKVTSGSNSSSVVALIVPRIRPNDSLLQAGEGPLDSGTRRPVVGEAHTTSTTPVSCAQHRVRAPSLRPSASGLSFISDGRGFIACHAREGGI